MAVKKEWGLEGKEYNVTTNCIYSRTTRGNLKVSGTGQVSPVLNIEPRIVMFINLSTNCNNEMTKEEIIGYANSYIEGSDLEKDIVLWKTRNHSTWRNNYVTDKIIPSRACLGDGWFHGFLRRWKDEIQFKPSTYTAFYRTEHCAYKKFEEMYNKVYNLLIQDGYAKPMTEPRCFDHLGKMCDGDVDAFGKLVDLQFTRPDLVFVADVCGRAWILGENFCAPRLHSVLPPYR